MKRSIVIFQLSYVGINTAIPRIFKRTQKNGSTSQKVVPKNINKVSRHLVKKCTRGKRNSVKCVERDLILGGVNPNGALSKLTTIRKIPHTGDKESLDRCGS